MMKEFQTKLTAFKITEEGFDFDTFALDHFCARRNAIAIAMAMVKPTKSNGAEIKRFRDREIN